MLKAIAFDGNGVLYYRDRDFAEALMEYIRLKHFPDFDRVSGGESFQKFMRMSFDGSIDKAAAVGLFLDAAGIAQEEIRADIIAREMEYSRRISIFPTEKETLIELARRGFKLGMITNSFQSAAEKASWFTRIGLGCVVETVVSSIDFGVSKPDPRIYLEFARRVGVAPAEAAFVGHEDYELRGAEKAGMQVISFNCSPELKADHHLESFSDLLAVAGQRQG